MKFEPESESESTSGRVAVGVWYSSAENKEATDSPSTQWAHQYLANKKAAQGSSSAGSTRLQWKTVLVVSPREAPKVPDQSAGEENLVDDWLWANEYEQPASIAPEALVDAPEPLIDIEPEAPLPVDGPASSPPVSEPEEPPTQEETPNGTERPKKAPTGAFLRWVKRIAALALVAMVIVFLAGRHAELRVMGPFNFLPAASADVRSSVDGMIDHVFVNEGDKVLTGKVIAVLSDRELRAALEKIDAEIRESQASLRLLQAGPSNQEIALTKAAISTATSEAGYANRKLERARLLLAEGLVARSAYEDAEEQAVKAQALVAEAMAKLSQVLNSIRPEQIDGVYAKIDQLESERRLIQKQMQSLRVLSPASGIVGSPQRQLMQMPNQFVKKGDSIAKIYDFRVLKAQIMISEKEISPVRLGQPIELRVRAFPDTVFRGKVTFIATSANDPANPLSNPNFSPGAPAIPSKSINNIIVYTELDNSSALLKPEMTGQAKIDCGLKPLHQLLLWHFKKYFRPDALSW